VRVSELQDKVCSREQAVERVAALKRPVVFTNGVFDVLHRGHVNYLHEASKLGGSLVVAVNSDASARMLGKGPDRPLNKAEDRAAVLAGLASVSLVTFFDERTPVSLIEAVRPDLYVRAAITTWRPWKRPAWSAAGVAMRWPFLLWMATRRLPWSSASVLAVGARSPFWTGTG